jgi:hypothetical protein
MDYAALRQEGIRQLERMAGGQWTDFNAHDPGITILEQLCYVLTDLAYRTAYEVPDGPRRGRRQERLGRATRAGSARALLPPHQGALSLSKDPPPSEPVQLKGLYRVLIEAVDPPPGDLQLNVVRRVHENRGLCEDFAAITVLSPQKIQVDATIEVGLVDDIGRLWAAVVQKISSTDASARTLSSSVANGSGGEMTSAIT